MSKPKSLVTTWELRTYDVLGNATDGYQVNDVSFQAEIEFRLRPTTNNVGTPHEFLSYHPSDRKIRAAFGYVRVQLDVDGDDVNIYVKRRRDGYPLGELYCVSHESLSGTIRERS